MKTSHKFGGAGCKVQDRGDARIEGCKDWPDTLRCSESCGY